MQSDADPDEDQIAGAIRGVIRNRHTREAIPDAVIILHSGALATKRVTQANSYGVYAFRDLPSGTYTVQVLYGRSDVAKVVTLAHGARLRSDFMIDPDDDGIVCRLPVDPRASLDVSLMSISATEARLLGVPNTTRRF